MTIDNLMNKELLLDARLRQIIKTYKDFPKPGIIFRDVLPVFEEPTLYSELIASMASIPTLNEADAIIAIDARGFLLGSSLSLKLDKPMIVARKTGKLPGQLISKSYNLEYGSNSLSIQREAIERYQTYVIVDDLLATGGTVKCVSNIVKSMGKKVLGLSVIIELSHLKGRSEIDFPVFSEVSY